MVHEKKVSYSLIVQILKECKDSNAAIETIENALKVSVKEAQKKKSLSGIEIADDSISVEPSVKISKRHLDEASNKVDSMMELKKVFKKYADSNKQPNNEAIFAFCKQLIENRLTSKEIEDWIF